jgi:hypothetical protein
MIHSFMLMTGVLDDARRAIDETGAAVRAVLQPEEMTCSKA